MDKIFTQWHSAAKSPSVTQAVAWNCSNWRAVAPPEPLMFCWGWTNGKHEGTLLLLLAVLALAPHTQLPPGQWEQVLRFLLLSAHQATLNESLHFLQVLVFNNPIKWKLILS